MGYDVGKPQHTYQILTKRPHRMAHKIRTLKLTIRFFVEPGQAGRRPRARLPREPGHGSPGVRYANPAVAPLSAAQ